MSRHRLLPAMLIVTLAVLPTVLVWPREFTNWDDGRFITENAAVQHPTATNLAFLTIYPVEGNLIPVTVLTYAADWWLYGNNAWGFALTNSLLYAGGCLMLVAAMVRGGIHRSIALTTGVLFAVHPAHVENVSWISGRKDLTCFLLLLCCQWAYMGFRRENRQRDRWLSVAFLLLAGLSKPMAMSAGPALLLYDVLILKRRMSESLRTLWPHIVVCAVILGQSFWLQSGAEAVKPLDDARWASADRAGMTILLDVLRSFAPVPFSPYYPQSIIDDVPRSLRWGALGLVVAISLGLTAGIRRFDGLRTVAYFWWLAILFLVPVSGLVPLGSTSLADRYLLVPSIGSCLLAGWALNRMPPRWTLVGTTLIAIALLGMFHLRALHWSNSVRLWESVIERYPSSAVGWKNLTTAHYQRQDLERAAEVALAGVEHQPAEISLVRNACEILMPLARLDEVEQLIEEARRAMPPRDELDLLSAKLALRRGEPSQAADILTSLLARQPEWADAWNTVSYAWQQLGDPDRAITAARSAVEHEPQESEFYRRLLSLQQTQGDLDAMERTAAKANQELPHFAEAWQVRISVLRELGRNFEADRVRMQAETYVSMRSGTRVSR